MAVEVKAKATLDSKGFNGGLTRMKGGVSKMTASIKSWAGAAALAFGTAGVVRFANKIVQLGTKLSDMAIRTGTTTEELQVFSAAARKAGASEENLANALTRVRDAQGRVIVGDKLMIEKFKQLGISAERVASAGMGELFMDIAKGITEANNGGEQFQALIQIMGQRNAPKLLEALNELATDGYGKVARAAIAAGQVMDDSLINSLDLAADEIDRLDRKTTIFFGNALVGARALKSIFGDMAKNGLSFTEARDKFVAEESERIQKRRATRREQAAKSAAANIATLEESLKDKAQAKRLTKERAARLSISSIEKAGAMIGRRSFVAPQRVAGAAGATASTGGAAAQVSKSNTILSKIEQNTREGGGLA